MKKSKSPTWQDRNRRRTTRHLMEADGRTLFIEGLTRAEVDTLRARVFYSGAADTYIASFGSALALATVELLKLRDRRKGDRSHAW
jgi:hypothetical protein